MGKLIMIRHGESMGNVWENAYSNDDTNFLTLRGIKQVELAGITLKRHGIEFDRMVSSQMTRARLTASIIAQTMDNWKRTHETDSRFNEWDFYNQEDYYTHVDRVHQGMRDLIGSDRHGLINPNTLLVTHHFTMQAIFGFILDTLDIPEGLRHCPNGVPFIYDTNIPGEIIPKSDWGYQKQY